MSDMDIVEIEFSAPKPEVFNMTTKHGHISLVVKPGKNKVKRYLYDKIKDSPLVRLANELPKAPETNELTSVEKLVGKYPTIKSLEKIKGIGTQMVIDLKNTYESIDAVKLALKEGKCSGRNDQVELLRKELLS